MKKGFAIVVGDDAHIVPNVRSTCRIFCIVSGSGANAETMLSLGTVLSNQKSYVSTGKEVQKPWFLANLWLLSVRTESNPREDGHADAAAYAK